MCVENVFLSLRDLRDFRNLNFSITTDNTYINNYVIAVALSFNRIKLQYEMRIDNECDMLKYM